MLTPPTSNPPNQNSSNPPNPLFSSDQPNHHSSRPEKHSRRGKRKKKLAWVAAEVRSATESEYYNQSGHYVVKPWIHPQPIGNSIKKPSNNKYLLVGTPKGPKISLDQERMEGLEKRINGVGWVEGEMNKPCISSSREELSISSIRATQNEKLMKVNTMSLSQTQPESAQIQPNSTDK